VKKVHQLLEKRKMVKWRKETVERIDDKVEDEVAAHERFIAQAKKAGEIAKLIVQKTDMRFNYPQIEAIGGEITIYDGTRNLVHHLAKKLRITFLKDFRKYGGSMMYHTKINGTTLKIRDIKDIPHCKIVKKTAVQEVTTYEITCK